MHDPPSTMRIYIGRLEFSIELVWSCGQNVQSWATSAQHRARFGSWGYHLYEIYVSHAPICFYLVDCQSIHTSKGKEIMVLLDSIYIVQVGYYCFIVIKFLPSVGKSLAHSGFALPESTCSSLKADLRVCSELPRCMTDVVRLVVLV